MREEAVPEGLLPVVHLPSRPLLPAHGCPCPREGVLGQLCPPKPGGGDALVKRGEGLLPATRWVACCSAGSPLPPHRHSGVLSAYGMALADIVHEAQEPCSLVYEPASFAQLDLRMAALEKTCVHALEAQGFARWAPRAGRAERGRGGGFGIQGGRCQAPPPLPADPRSPPRPSCTCATSGQTAPSCARPRATRPTPAPAAAETLVQPLPIGQWHNHPHTPRELGLRGPSL